MWLWTGALLVVAATGAVIAVSLSQRTAPAPPKAVSTIAENKRACLLSDQGQPASATVFADMQQAAKAQGHVNVQQATLPAHATDAAPELAGLIQQQCIAVFTLGPLSTNAARAAATNTQPHAVAFIAITDSPVSGNNITALSPTTLTSDQITASLNTALR